MLGILQGYYHPTMGKDYLLCSKCFNQISESVEQWKKFVLANSFNSESPSIEISKFPKDLVSKISKAKSFFQPSETERISTIKF